MTQMNKMLEQINKLKSEMQQKDEALNAIPDRRQVQLAAGGEVRFVRYWLR